MEQYLHYHNQRWINHQGAILGQLEHLCVVEEGARKRATNPFAIIFM